MNNTIKQIKKEVGGWKLFSIYLVTTISAFVFFFINFSFVNDTAQKILPLLFSCIAGILSNIWSSLFTKKDKFEREINYESMIETVLYILITALVSLFVMFIFSAIKFIALYFAWVSGNYVHQLYLKLNER